MKLLRLAAAVVMTVAFPLCAFAQQAILQGGPWQPGHSPMYVGQGSSQPIVQDSGPAGGGGLGLGLSEQLLQARSPTNTYPAVNAGTGPFGTNWCDYDAPITNAAGYHFLCMSPNVNGGALIAAGAGGTAAPSSLTFNINGVTYPFPISGSGSTITSVINNSALRALSTTSLSVVQRLGFTAVGDSPVITYTASLSPCSLNSGAGDNGSQVQSTNGGCWIANFQGVQVTPMVFGAKGDGATADDTPVQAAANAMQNGTLYLGTKSYVLNTGLTINYPLIIQGSGGGKGIYDGSCSSGFFVGVDGITAVKSASNGVTIQNVCITTKGGVTATNWTGYSVGQYLSNAFKTSQINGACIGADISAVQNNQNLYTQILSSIFRPYNRGDCSAIRLGVNSVQSQTGDIVVQNVGIYCSAGGATSTGVLINDGGGIFFSHNDIYGCGYGTRIYPGTNQIVANMFFSDTVVGDTSTTNDLLIDSASSNAAIQKLLFNGAWTSNASGGPSTLIQNTAGTTSFVGFHFVGHWFIPNGDNDAFVVNAGSSGAITDVTVDSSRVCSGKSGAAAGNGIKLVGSALSDVSIRGTRIGTCDSFVGGTLATGINIDTTVTQNLGVISNNDLTNTVLPINWNGATASRNAIITNNFGVDDQSSAPITAAATIALPMNSIINISGTTSITRINTVWTGRSVQILSQSGLLNFSSIGGNICNNLSTTTTFQMVQGTYIASLGCWLLK